MTNAKPVELQREDLVGKLWAMHGIAQSSSDGFTYLNDAARVVISEASALISQLAVEKIAVITRAECAENGLLALLEALNNASGHKNGLMAIRLLVERAEAAEKRTKELEEGRDLDKVVLDEGIEILIDAEASNKLLSERVAVLEAAIAPFEKLAKAVFRVDDGREMNGTKPDDNSVWGFDRVTITYGDLRRARTALEGK